MATLIPLGGAAVGVVGTLVVQWLSRRQTSALSLAARKSALRDDRRDAIYAVLEAVQEVDRHVDSRTQGRDYDPDLARVALHHLYYRQKCLNIIASDALSEAVDGFTHQMHVAVHDPPTDRNIYEFMKEKRQLFMKIARQELYSNELYQQAPDR